MTSRKRNLSIIALVLVLLAGSLAVISTKKTVLGLDLRGGVELVYQGQPTPQVPTVTPEAMDDAIETIRKRTDALGVSEPEIQRAGRDQISIGLPDVDNADRAIAQVGTTAQLQFYDWEPNVLGERGDTPYTGSRGLFQAVEVASEQKPKAEQEDLGPEPAEGESTGAADEGNNSDEDTYYLFDEDQHPIAGPDVNCQELLSDFEGVTGPKRESKDVPKDSECRDELLAIPVGNAGAPGEESSAKRDSGPPAGSVVLKVPSGVIVIEGERVPEQPENLKRYYVLEDDSELSGRDIKNPEQNFDQGTNEPIVTMEFTDKGRKAFASVTKRIAQRGQECSTITVPALAEECLGRFGPGDDGGSPIALQRFAITLDNKIVSLATIDYRENPEGIDGRTGAQINGIGDIQETQDLAESLRIGALPIKLKLISQTQVSATLGQQALDEGLLAGGAGLALTLLFLLVFYRVLGAIAGVALVLYAVFLFALVKLIPITMTLPGIAGTILTLAVAADANIVIFERIKEEARAGRSIPAAISSGYAKALRTIIDANVVTIGVAFILFTLATAGVKGFAFTLGVGTIVSLFTAVLATSAILGALARSRLLRSRFAIGVRDEDADKERWRFDFVGSSKVFFSISGLILVAGALGIAGKGINFGIDFESGTRLKAPLEQQTNVDDVRQALPAEFRDAKIQKVDEPELGNSVYQIAVSELDPQDKSIENALDGEFGLDRTELNRNSIGPTFGEQIARTALLAIVASLILISIYIALRFEWKFAVPVLIALAHDILITSGVYALVGREVTTSTVAALLTILGYSLYDTIIVFDRIRENVPRMPRATFSQIVNRSMSEVLTRSIATSASTLFPITALLLFGGETLQDFAFALLVGVASGAYSSIFIAAPVVVLWKEREPIYVRRRKIALDEHGGEVPAFADATIGDEPAAQRAPAQSPKPSRRRRAAAAKPRPAVAGPPIDEAPQPPPPPQPAPVERAAPEPEPEAAPEPPSRTSSTGGAEAPRPKPKQGASRSRGRRKHGRR